VLRNVSNFDRDRAQELADARQLVANKELEMEAARKNLADFDANYQALLASAALKKANAEDARDIAEDNLTEFLINPVRNVREGQLIDVELLQRLEAAVEEARTQLTTAENELNKLRNDRQLLLEEARAAVPRVEAELVRGQDDLARLEREADRNLSLQMRQANFEVAQARLAQAEVDFQKEMTGPDQLILRQLEAGLESAQAQLSQARADLEKERGGPDQAELAVREKAVALARKNLEDLVAPDSFDVALRQANVTAAQARVDDALEELEGATVRAPWDGIVSRVNIAVEDNVNDKSRVLEIIDPREVEVDGLVDAVDFRFVEEGATVSVTISSLPGEEFPGRVIRIAEEPRTERGVVSYPVRIAVDLPEGLEVPVRLSAVSATVLYRGGSGP